MCISASNQKNLDITSLEQTNQQIQGEIRILTRDKHVLTELLENSKQNSVRLTEEYTSRAFEMDTMKQEIKEKHQKILDFQKHCSRLKDTITQRESKILQLGETNDRAVMKTEEIEKRANLAKSEILKLKTELSKAQQKDENLNILENKWREEVEQLRTDASQLTRQINDNAYESNRAEHILARTQAEKDEVPAIYLFHLFFS